MRPIRLLLVSALALASSAGAQVITGASARSDFDVLRHALEEAHGALYRWTPKPVLDAKFDSARAALRPDMSQQEFAYAVAAMIAQIGDGHSRLEFPSATVSELSAAKLFPLRLAIEDSRAIVVNNETAADSTFRPGDEVVEINGIGMKALIGRLLPVIPRDGVIETGRRYRAGRNFAATYWLYISHADTFAVKAMNTAGNASE